MQYAFIYMSRNYPLICSKTSKQRLIKHIQANLKGANLDQWFRFESLTLQTWTAYFRTWKDFLWK